MVTPVPSLGCLRLEEEDRVKAQGVVFLGVRTADTDVMAAFFTDVMGFPVAEKAHDFVRFQLPNRDQIELWGPSRETQAHVTTGPMPEFLVHDVEQAQAELEAAGVEILSPVRVLARGLRLRALPRARRQRLRRCQWPVLRLEHVAVGAGERSPCRRQAP